jgi:glycosyltransferase involved in cell wall biosynthesis
MPAPNQKLSLIVPAYNKNSEVFESVCSFVNELKLLPFDWEIIVVDDASRDQTLREAVRSKKFNGNTKNIKIFSYDLNQGKGFALYYGFQKSFGDIVVFADSDLDLPSKNITTVLNNLVHSKADIAIGSKRHPASQVHYPFLRRVQSKTYQILVQLLFNLNISDTQVGIKAFRRKVLEDCFPRIVVKQFAFDLELLVVANLLGYKRIIEAPIVLNYHFSSTIRLKSILKILQDTAAIFYRKNWLKYYQQTHNRLQRDKSLVSLQKAFI